MKKVLKRLSILICLPIVSNILLFHNFFFLHNFQYLKFLFEFGLIAYWIFLNILPFLPAKDASARLTIMMGGRTLCYCGLYGTFSQFFIFLCYYPTLLADKVSPVLLTVNAILSTLLILFILWNGILRIFFLSRRLGIKKRLLMLLCMWIPLVNLVVLLYALRKVHEEYDFGCNQAAIRKVRTESDICQTKYPLLLVHGVGFRDLRYFNYWGRIPKELTRYGATIYYGHQEAFGTIVYNANDIHKKILEILQQTGAQKVNIIAHSKGGLDARYAISQLGSDQYVASLTTMNTPHRGCRFVDYACRLPDGFYRFIAKIFDRMFLRFGDKNPDFYTATRQFSTETSQEFNENVRNAPSVYYQSFTTIMKHCFSDLLLTIPYCMIYPLEGKNDGLVSISSAKWGDFKGVITNRHRRGISHGDIIDLKREDYRGFNVVEHYVQIVSQLKIMGF